MSRLTALERGAIVPRMPSKKWKAASALLFLCHQRPALVKGTDHVSPPTDVGIFFKKKAEDRSRKRYNIKL
jgi:hypothetical protein